MATKNTYIVPAIKLQVVRDKGVEPIRATRVAEPSVAADVLRHFCCEQDDPFTESMWAIAVDGRGRMRGAVMVAKGGCHGLVVSAREILRAMIAASASAFILGHNHPSGDPEPSEEDIHMTRAVAQAAKVVGIPLLDHVVVTDGPRWTSILEARGDLESL